MRYVLGFLLGALICGATAFGIGLIALDRGWVSTQEGAAAMGIAFFITPAAAIVGGILGAVVAGLRRRQP